MWPVLWIYFVCQDTYLLAKYRRGIGRGCGAEDAISMYIHTLRLQFQYHSMIFTVSKQGFDSHHPSDPVEEKLRTHSDPARYNSQIINFNFIQNNIKVSTDA